MDVVGFDVVVLFVSTLIEVSFVLLLTCMLLVLAYATPTKTPVAIATIINISNISANGDISTFRNARFVGNFITGFVSVFNIFVTELTL